MTYITPRSVTALEDEIKKLEQGEEQQQEDNQEEVLEQPSDTLIEKPKEAEPTGEEASFKKRYGDLRRHSQSLENKIKDLEKRLNEKDKASNIPDITSLAEAKEWAKANPEAAKIIKALATEQVNSIAPSNSDVKGVQESLDKLRKENQIRKAHPDFDEIVGDDNFHAWADSQPAQIKNIVFSSDADDVIWALNFYKQETKNKDFDPKKEAAKTVKTRNVSVPADKAEGRFSESQVQKMSMPEYEKFAPDIEKSIKEGTFIYDLSGAAR